MAVGPDLHLRAHWNGGRELDVSTDETSAESEMGDSSDIHNGVDHPASRNGVNDPVDGVDVKLTFNDNQTSHERAQWAADVRAKASPRRGEAFLLA
jgi:hypothetical protein